MPTFADATAVTTPADPTELPVSVAKAKLHLRVDHGDEDTYIETLIGAATEQAQDFLNRQIVTATLTLYLDAFPLCEIRIPQPPLQSITSIAYVDGDGDTQTLAASAYQVDTTSFVGRILPAYGTSWPSTRDVPNAVTITYKAGYGASEDVPKAIEAAILFLVSHWYRNRDGQATPDAFWHLLSLADRVVPIG